MCDTPIARITGCVSSLRIIGQRLPLQLQCSYHARICTRYDVGVDSVVYRLVFLPGSMNRSSYLICQCRPKYKYTLRTWKYSSSFESTAVLMVALSKYSQWFQVLLLIVARRTDSSISLSIAIKLPTKRVSPQILLFICRLQTMGGNESMCYFFFFLFFFILRRMGKSKALAHHTFTYFHTRRVSI